MTPKRTLRIAIAPLCLLMAGCSSMNQTLDLQRQTLEQQQSILAELGKLNTRVDQLMAEEEVSVELNERIAYLTSITEQPSLGNANIEALAAIPVPEGKSGPAVQQYIAKILAVSAGQRFSNSGDTQVAMLSALGEENLPVLLEAMAKTKSRAPRHHLRYAITELANETTKNAIIESFKKHPDSNELLSIIQQKHWISDVKGILISNLERSLSDSNNRYVNSNILRPVAELKDAETYPLLLKCFIEQENRSYTYSAISKLPDIQLEAATLEAWKNTEGISNERERTYMAALAVPLGEKSALEYMIGRLGEKPGSSNRPDPRTIVLAHIDFSGSDKEIKAWYFTNRDAIRFNKEKGQFSVDSETSEKTDP